MLNTGLPSNLTKAEARSGLGPHYEQSVIFSPEYLTRRQPLCLTEKDTGFGSVLPRIKFF